MNVIGIIDYGVNNISSVAKALDKLTIPYEFVRESRAFDEFDHLILPGVGAFEQACYNLEKTGLKEAIQRAVGRGTYLLGMCLGMQLLFETSEESHDAAIGLSLIPGSCKLLPHFSDPRIHVPHAGWNTLHSKAPSQVLNESSDQSDFYFVHSYYVATDNPDVVTATSNHGIEFAAVVEFENVVGTQFHPEKSSTKGLELLQRFSLLS